MLMHYTYALFTSILPSLSTPSSYSRDSLPTLFNRNRMQATSFYKDFTIFTFMCFACICPCTMSVQSVQRSEEDVTSPWTLGIDGSELSYGCWQLNVDSLEEQPVNLTTEPCLHSTPSNTHVIFNFPIGNIYLRTGGNSFNGRFGLTHYLQSTLISNCNQ